MSLADNIYRFRTEQNMSQQALAEALDVSRQSVSKWETGTAVPELDKLVKMSELFGVTLDTLVGRETSEKPAPPPAEPAPVQKVIIQHSFHALTPRMVIGVALIVVGLLLLPMGLSSTAFRPAVTCFTLCAAFVLAGFGVLLMKYPYVFLGWILVGVWAVFTFLLQPRWEKAYLHLFVFWLSAAGMIVWTVKANQKGKIHVPNWLWWLGGLLLIGALVLFFLNFPILSFIGSETHDAVEVTTGM